MKQDAVSYGVSWSGFLHLACKMVQLVWIGNFFAAYPSLPVIHPEICFLVSPQGEFGSLGIYCTRYLMISHQLIQQISPTSRSPVALSGDLGRVGRYSDHQLAYLGMA